jgi:hypothetical protein
LPAVLLAGLSGATNAQMPPWGQPLRWEKIYTPGIIGELIPYPPNPPPEINRIAASHDIIYALDTVNWRLHYSDNGGLTFTDITGPLKRAGAGLPGWEIAAAPGLPQYVAVVTDDRSDVWVSSDSGETWQPTSGLALGTNEKIQCIAISNGYSSPSNPTLLLHDIAIGTWDSVSVPPVGRVYTYQMGGTLSSWTDQSLTINTTNDPAGNKIDISAVAFSPKYTSDATILAVASSSANTYLCIGLRDTSSYQTTTWNNVAGYPITIASGRPTAIPPTSEGYTGAAGIVSSISLPSDYSGDNQKTRKAFVSFYRTLLPPSPPSDTNNDVYRIDESISQQLQRLNVNGGAAADLSSIAYFGTLISGKLLAGFVEPVGNTAQVKWTVNPLGTPLGTPGSTVWYIALEPPSGPGNAQVAWSYSGAVAFCATGADQPTIQPPTPLPIPPPPPYLNDESSFSQSLDNGSNWQQTSLMNTNISITDIAPAPDSASLFMATYTSSGPESVWRAAGEPLGQYWGRLLNMPTLTNRLILRLSPDYVTDYTLYAVEVDNWTSQYLPKPLNNLLYISLNRGNTWTWRFIPQPVIDMVTAGQYTLYLATSQGCVRKSTDGGVNWGDKVTTGLKDINMLAVSDNGHIFAGSTDGYVAYSTDEGASFTEIPLPVSFSLSDIQVTPDANYAANNIIYAGGRTTANVTGGIWRWTIGQSAKWEQIDIPIADKVTGEQVSGLKVGPEGTLYALMAENISGRFGGMIRTLDPAYPVAELMEWDVVNRTLTGNAIAFDPAPLDFAGDVPWLKLSGDTGENDLWAVDTSNGSNDNTTGIYRFRDTLCKAGPWTTGPSEVGSDPVSGRNQQADISWEQLSLSDRYELQVAKDPAFDQRINPAISNSDNISSVKGSILIKTDPVDVTSPALWLPPGSLPEAGADYFWRVRTYHAATGEYIRSDWSDTLNFIVKPGYPVTTPYYGPQVLSPAAGSECAADAPVSFSWTPYKDITQYKFELSENSNMSRPLISSTVSGTALLYAGQLKSGTAYFWRVTPTQPTPGDPSATFGFHTTPAAAPAPLIPRSQTIPLWAVVGIAIGMLAIVFLLVLIFRRRGLFS